MSLPGRLFNVFAVPGEVFEDIKNTAPSVANWLAPALIFIVVNWLAGWLMFSQASIQQQLREVTDRAVQKQIDKAHLPPAQAEQVREAAAKWGSLGPRIGAVAAPPFVAFATPFWGGLILWLVGAKVLRARFSYMKAVEVAGLGSMIGVLDVIVRTLLIVGMGSLYATPSLALLVKEFDPQNLVHALLASMNLMTFWYLTVRAVGLARLSGASFLKAAAWIFGIWAVVIGLRLGYTAALQALFNR